MPNIQLDLSTKIDYRTGKVLGFGQNKVNFEKLETARFYSHKFSEDSSQIFTSQKIEILSGNISRYKTDEIVIDKFYTDIDYAISNANQLSDDGFVLIAGYMSNVFDRGYADTLVVDGKVNGSGVIVHNPPSGEGTGWKSLKVKCSPNSTYQVLNADNSQALNLVFAKYTIDNTFIGLYTPTSNEFISDSNTHAAIVTGKQIGRAHV